MLPHEQTGFRSHLAAQVSLLDFFSVLERINPMGNYAVAIFFDPQRAFDSVGAQTAIGCLRALGLRGRIFRFLGCYLEGRLFSVKLGSLVS